MSKTIDNSASPVHPGQYIRDKILKPKKLSVSDAAKLVGVGRPAFSNFLNGNVTTTPEMASRIEVAFSISVQDLLDMQAAYDASRVKLKDLPANAIPYVAPFLTIKANEIENWADQNITARTRLSVLLRTLINSTGGNLVKIDFPGNDDAERPGWDGYIESAQATPWIPEGQSGWEFGTNQDIKGKADDDFAKNVRLISKEERAQITFIFVTPRSWKSKSKWIQENKAKSQWKDVRVYDSSDLEQWLEQSIAGQTWFANETGKLSHGVRTLDKCWCDWANVTNPPLVSSFFTPAIENVGKTISSSISNSNIKPIVITADSTEEALAFLAILFGPFGPPALSRLEDNILVFDETGVIPNLAKGSKNFVAVTSNRNVEQELGPYAHLIRTIVVYPRNAANVTPDVVLEPLNYVTFQKSLEEMGYDRDKIAKLSNESGRSLTVLRRRLATIPVIRTPSWASVSDLAIQLVPFLLIGAWNSTNASDQTVLKLIANIDNFDELEKKCGQLSTINDAPIWSLGTYRGVVSKIDLLFTISNTITRQNLENFYSIAKIVLSEDDPKLDLPEQKRWSAAIYGKSREFSNALRKGLLETLVLLSVYGNSLFLMRLGFNCEHESAKLVRELLTPLNTRTLTSNESDLAAYAEAAPNEFLSILEEDLRTTNPETYSLLKPVDSSIFGGSCPRSGLLWALEGLAWSPETLLRSASILAQLAQINIDDNWVNKPINSLESIFRVWMPQTAANHEMRFAVFKRLVDTFPNVMWKICISQINTGHSVGHYSHKPSWRNDAQGHGEPFKTSAPVLAFMKEIANLVINWQYDYSTDMLCDLIQHIHDLTEEYQEKVWSLVSSWSKTMASEKDKAIVREKIRVTVMSRRGFNKSKITDISALSTSANKIYKALEPSDLIHKYEWLFREQWVEESMDEIQDTNFDYDLRQKRISKLRVEALKEINKNRGVSGILELAEIGKASYQIGWHMAQDVLLENEISNLLSAALKFESGNQSWNQKNLARGAMEAVQDNAKREAILYKVKESLTDSEFLQLLLQAPFGRSTWIMVDAQGENQRDTYWREVHPNLISVSTEEVNEAIKYLIDAKRPRAAFNLVHYKLEVVEPQLLYQLLSEMAKNESNDKPGEYQLNQYYIEEAFKLMDKNTDLSSDQKAALEFVYIEALARPWDKGYGIPNLEKYIEDHPEFFVQAIVWAYRRASGGIDPEEFRVNQDQLQNLATKGYNLLEALNRIPGYELEELKVNKLFQWLNKVRELATNLDRQAIADVCIGKLLSCAPIGKDGVWPCEPVRQVIEDIHSKDIVNGAHVGLYNSRGVVLRAEGGGQERELADKYRKWANALLYSHPFVATELLMKMVSTYENEADREDIEAGIKNRLH